MSKEIKDILESIQKAQHDQHEALEAKNADLVAKLDDAQAQNELELKEVKTALAKANVASAVAEHVEDKDVEYKSAFFDFIRTGDESGLREIKAVTANTVNDADGAYLVPENISLAVTELSREINVLEGLFSQQTISTAAYIKNIQTGTTTTRWVDEVTDITTATNTYDQVPSFSRIVIPAHSLVSEPSVSLELLEDASVSVEDLLITEISKEMAAVTENALAQGDGVGKPQGILTVSGADESITSVQEVAGGIDGDSLIALIYSIKSQYRGEAKFVMNRNTLEKIRKLKDSNNNYLFQYTQQHQGAGVIGALLGYDVVTSEGYTDDVVTFGAHSGYTVVQRLGMSLLRNPYRVSGAVSLYSRKRIGGGLTDAQGLRILRA